MKDCFARCDVLGDSLSEEDEEDSDDNDACFRCGRVGHWAQTATPASILMEPRCD